MIIVLYFTYGVSVETWYNQGLLDREKAIYERMIEDGKVEKYYWLTYGSNDRQYKKYLNKNIEIVSMPKLFNNGIGIFIYSFMNAILNRKVFENADIIKTNQVKGAWSAIIASVLYGLPLLLRSGYTWSMIQQSKSKLKYCLSSIIECILYKYTDISIVTTDYQKRHIIEKYKIPEEKVEVIPNYVDTNVFKPSGSQDKLAQKLLFVGRLHKEKGLKDIITALSGTDYSLDIYGSGEERGNLEEYSKNIEVGVNFLGNVRNSKLPEIYAKYKCFVLFSDYENMPKALIEAMSCGLAVIGSDVRGINEIISNNINGCLISKNNSEHLKNAIIYIMENNEYRKNMGKNAREYVKEKFSLDIISERENDIYIKIPQTKN